jgi:hypothetical protein
MDLTWIVNERGQRMGGITHAWRILHGAKYTLCGYPIVGPDWWLDEGEYVNVSCMRCKNRIRQAIVTKVMALACSRPNDVELLNILNKPLEGI